MTDRLSGLVLLVFALWFGALAWRLPQSFFSDPVGSRTFPLIVAVFLTPLALYLMLRPSSGKVAWPPRASLLPLALTVVILLAYAWLLQPLGFLVATFLAFAALALVFRAPLARALLASLVTTLALYGLFDRLLELYLPTGELLGRWFG